MARPTTKNELLKSATINFDKLMDMIDKADGNIITAQFNFDDRDKNVKDVLVHLFEWHRLLLKWIRNNIEGIRSSFLPEPYNWKTYPDMNLEFWKKHIDTSFIEAKSLLLQSHEEVMSIINEFSDEELFTKAHFNWTGTTSIAAYCISATSSHYDWAIKKIKKHIKG